MVVGAMDMAHLVGKEMDKVAVWVFGRGSSIEM